jgi:hypothetical protein
MTQEQTRPAVGKQRGKKQYIVAAVVVVLLLAAVGASSYYSEEIQLYLSLGGWNKGAARHVTQQFIAAMQAGKIQDAVALVDPGSYKPYDEGGKQAGLERAEEGRGRYYVPFDHMIPPGKVEFRAIQLTSLDRGGFEVPVRFADGTEGWFVVSRVGKEYRITGVPTIPGRFHY